MINFENFYIETYGVWKICSEPNRAPDFKSTKPNSASKYWDCGDYVVRKSNHWGVVGSCFWRVDGAKKKQALNFAQPICAMIYYKDFGPSKTPTKNKSPKEKFKNMKPHIHHEGPITTELATEIIGKLDANAEEVLAYAPTDEEYDLVGPDWLLCQAEWHSNLKYASQRISSIAKKLHYKEADDIDGLCIDIALSILSDYDQAKLDRFMVKLS